jgi:hippurate hydrolase
MFKHLFFVFIIVQMFYTTSAFSEEFSKEITTKHTPELMKFYEYLHENPELSFQEFKTAAVLASELKKMGFEVKEKIGRTGIVGVFRNGKGPTVLVRTDMDGLPVLENTKLPYASKAVARNDKGLDTGVMHACGHDLHMTNWVGTARILTSIKNNWSGTLVFIAQPAEEIGAGAKAMLDDGLFRDFPKPDFCIALHCDAARPAGTIAVREGLACANVDSVDIVVKGKGGHGAAPHATIDPIVLAARIILDLQTLVSREVNPLDPAVVTVGSIHGGTKHNIIPSEVKLQLTVRTFKDDVRNQVLNGIERIAKAAAIGANAPEPEILIRNNEFTPALSNDIPLTQRLRKVWEDKLGKEFVSMPEQVMWGEDFGRYGKAGIPSCMFFLGTASKKKYEESLINKNASLPSLHSEYYNPDMPASLETGINATVSAVLDLLKK